MGSHCGPRTTVPWNFHPDGIETVKALMLFRVGSLTVPVLSESANVNGVSRAPDDNPDQGPANHARAPQPFTPNRESDSGGVRRERTARGTAGQSGTKDDRGRFPWLPILQRNVDGDKMRTTPRDESPFLM